MILAPCFLLFGYALGTFGAIGAGVYVFALVAFWLAFVFETLDLGEPLLNNRETLFVALVQVAGFVLLLFRLTSDLRGAL